MTTRLKKFDSPWTVGNGQGVTGTGRERRERAGSDGNEQGATSAFESISKRVSSQSARFVNGETDDGRRARRTGTG